MRRKMIFFDVDGTIVPENTDIVSASTVKAIKKARENGHLVFINTGRTFFNITKKIRSIGFDGYVCGCGTYINYKGKILFHKTVPHENCIEIAKMLRKCKINAILEGTNNVYFDQTQPLTGELAEIKEHFRKQGYDITKSWDAPDIVFEKFVTWISEGSDLKTFLSYITRDFEYIDRGNNFAEFIPKGCSKATGIKFLQEYFKIPLEDCYAIGDSTNDLPMLKYVPNSILMGNGTPLLFKLVSYVTKTIENDGIEYALLHYNII